MGMKLHFEPDLDYQLRAIESVCDLFRGQETCRTEFTVTQPSHGGQESLPGMDGPLGIGNRQQLLPEEMLANLRDVQLANGLPQSGTLASTDFTVEMETGTGKTYVYLRTIFELNRKYGFTKFVIVVPSVAIKEGVYKALKMTEDHFKGLYAGTPCEYFLYDSSKPGQVRNFATSPQIQVMVVTVGAINKRDVNNLYKQHEGINDEKPIDLIRRTRPILIVDEPQTVDGGLQGKGREALDSMNALCTLRYSATHVDKHHMLYRLDAVDAYDARLVKQIEVAAATIEGAHNKPYVRLMSVKQSKKTVTATVELDVATATGVRRKEVRVEDGDDLEQTTGRDVYEGCLIGEIRGKKNEEHLELRVPGGEHFLKLGESHGDVDSTAVARQMIHRTIKEHLDKELRLRPQGIKVLSLFFLGSVSDYRSYDDDGNQMKGPLALIFEEEYARLARNPAYKTLFGSIDDSAPVEDVHNGYFSIDKKGGWTDTADNTQTHRDSAERAYNLIMKDKERLLSFDTPLKFIFSHSALREGWDNPNVFQICGLRDIRSERERRQTIGRGLRLCVNQDGQRVRGFEVNTLTVIATESYESFAENLQKEIERDTGIRFGVVEPHQFASLTSTSEDGSSVALGEEQSKLIWEHLKDQGFIDSQGRVQDSLKEALKAGELPLPEDFAAQQEQVVDLLKKLAGRLEVKNAEDRRTIKPRRAVLESEEFKALWDRIKHKTTYRVQFDNEKLLQDCVAAIKAGPPISRTRLQWHVAELAIAKSGVEATRREGSQRVAVDEGDIELPDILTDLQDRTQLTRKSIYRILIGCERLNDFKQNPQQFIALVADCVNRSKQKALVDGIKYQRLGDTEVYAQSLFEEEELTGYLKNMLEETQKSVFEHVVYDSDVERTFAQELEQNDAVRVYAKLPGWFTVPTPLGGYNPDWAVLLNTAEGERLYFVVETKGSLFVDDLRGKEGDKITCGKAHFKALGVSEASAEYIVARNANDVLDRVTS